MFYESSEARNGEGVACTKHCCVRAFGVIRIQKDFHEDITPRGIHRRCIKATNLFSFAMEIFASLAIQKAPHMPRSMIIMIACGMKRMKSVLKFIVAINPSSRKFQ